MPPSDTWPAWATAPVLVAPHDPGWSRRGRELAARLDELLVAWRTRPTEHVGSTAVPGLAAKPVLDLQVALPDFAGTAEIMVALARDGWHPVPPELDRRPWRRFFVLPDGERRAAHLHLLLDGGDRWRAQLAFRDALRASAELAAEYAGIKRELAAANPHDREAYTRGKDDFLRRFSDEFGAAAGSTLRTDREERPWAP
jgi:GrpB-like predicted nucleotidyltransferase (UPF0157 family)